MRIMLERILKNVLLFKIEYFVTPLFIVLFILSLKYVGFYCVRDTIFNIMLFFTIPACFISFRVSRKMLYKVWFGGKKRYYED